MTVDERRFSRRLIMKYINEFEVKSDQIEGIKVCSDSNDRLLRFGAKGYQIYANCQGQTLR